MKFTRNLMALLARSCNTWFDLVLMSFFLGELQGLKMVPPYLIQAWKWVDPLPSRHGQWVSKGYPIGYPQPRNRAARFTFQGMATAQPRSEIYLPRHGNRAARFTFQGMTTAQNRDFSHVYTAKQPRKIIFPLFFM